MAESRSAQKNKRRREKKKPAETLSTDCDNEEETVKKVAPAEEINPIELVKKKIEEAKLAKDHKKTQELREQLWALQDQAAGKVVKDAPDINPAFLQPEVKTQAKGKDETPVSSGNSNDKRLKQLRKKLDQITKLKEKQDKGETLEQNQLAKLETEQEILDEIDAIEEVCKQLTLR
ncbi:eukaryotic translation initiation factor 2A-like isoform X2 [Dysidea avara]|uniref:eukaryotic translation initiation factor 2A-like isoform X2 n=1 Tax=Dysidea avara TaxID=196820 RepID=UPI00331C8A32